MSNYHILTQAENRKSVTVVFHVPIPEAGTNQAGISWRDAVVKEQGGSSEIVSVLPDITTQEHTAMKAGEIYEIQERVRFSSVTLTNAERKTQIEAWFTKLQTELVAEKQVTLEWIGLEGDV